MAELAELSLRWKSYRAIPEEQYIAHSGYYFVKRLFDIVGATVSGILFCVPFLILLFVSKYMIRIGWHTPGHLFLLSHRVGKDGRRFTMVKLRTMPTDIHFGGRKWGDDLHDAKTVGRWGRFLRTSKLDELPQLWNVFIGQMSLVGPRPEMPITHESYSLYLPDFPKRVQGILPGMTGTTQLKVFTAHPRDVYRKYRLDIFYIQHQSLGYDLLILSRTAKLWIRLIFEAVQELCMSVKNESIQ